MFPHGVRPAAIPRATIDRPFAASPVVPTTVAAAWNDVLRNARYANESTIAAMYSSRRKVWVRAEPTNAGSVVQIGGFALQRKDRFEEAFPKLVEDLNAAITRIPADRREEVGAR